MAAAPRRAIDAAAHVIEHFGHVLDLVQHRRQTHAVEKSLRIVAKTRHHIGILLSAKKFHQIAIAQDGFPVPMVAPDPRLFALHTLWLAEQPDRELMKKGRDRAQGQAVLRLVLERLPQYPLDAHVLKGLPVDVRTPKLKVPRNI